MIGQRELLCNDALENKIDESKTNGTFIIGAGFGRTGTSSMQIALNKLGFRAFHMRELEKDRKKMHLIIKVAKLKLKLKRQDDDDNDIDNVWDSMVLNKNDFNWNDIFETDKGKFNATVDFPVCGFYLDLMKYYDNNYKVILTVRDDEHTWYQSIRDTLFKFQQIRINYWFVRLLMYPQTKLMQLAVGEIVFNTKHKNMWQNEENCKKIYNEWIESVKKNVPKEKLLIFNVKQGWKPLCKFLDIQIPNQPFPRSNDSKFMSDAAKKLTILANICHYIIIILIAIMIYSIILICIG